MLVESVEVPAWLAALQSSLAAQRTIDLEVYATGERRMMAPKPVLLGLFERLDARLFRRHRDAFAPVRIDAQIGAPESFEGRDVVLDFATVHPATLARGVRYGVWTLSHSADDALRGVRLFRVQIDAVSADGTSLSVYRSFGAVDPASLTRTRNYALWKAQAAFSHRLENVRRRGLMDAVAAPATRSAATRPSNAAVARHAAKAALGVAHRRARALREHEEWFVAARPRKGPPLTGVDVDSLDGFRPISAPVASSVADPFVFEDGDDTYVFFEEEDLATSKAHISYIRLDELARPLTEPAKALVAPYHLSYPFVFRHEGDVFMIPESSANATVELHRASPFPSTWILDRVLLDGIRALDPTLHVEGERLWLFVTLTEEGAAPNDELHLYSSTTLHGPWEPHPANPVVSDARSARPAGRLFRHGPTLVRPAQDCSRRYGFAIVFNRVDVITETRYAETPVGRIEPSWYPNIVATHTYNFGSRVEVLDGKRLVPRRVFGRPDS
jgi:hypothetical protein